VARVNLEEDAFVRTPRLADFVGAEDTTAMGVCAYLWRESQQILKTHGTREEIIDWARLYNKDEAEQNRWLKALCRARIISLVGEDSYLIHGNETQIEGRVARLHRSAKGAAATKDKWAKLKNGAPSTLQAGLEQASSLVQAGPEQASSTLEPGSNHAQFNSIQFNSDQEGEESDSPDGAPPLLTAENSEEDPLGLTAVKPKPGEVIDLWNEICAPKDFARCRPTARRATGIRARLDILPTLKHWREFFDQVAASPFLSGQNDRGWKANIDWVLNETNATKILEGNYSTKPKASRPTQFTNTRPPAILPPEAPGRDLT